MEHPRRKTKEEMTHPEKSHPGVAGRKFGVYRFTPEQMQEEVNAWCESFKKDEENEKLTPTVTHLAYHIGISRQGLLDYKNRDEFHNIISRAKTFCEMHTEQQLFNPNIRGAGPIFNLKANYGWRDGSEGKNINFNFNWNTVQAAAAKKRKQLEAPDYVPDPDTIDI